MENLRYASNNDELHQVDMPCHERDDVSQVGRLTGTQAQESSPHALLSEQGLKGVRVEFHGHGPGHHSIPLQGWRRLSAN